MTPLDVMLLESDPGAADTAADALRAAGHCVHRCHEPGLGAFPCNGTLDPKRCPLMGVVDVALVVRRHAYPQATRLEQDGVSCAIRAGVPIVADGPAVLDPFEPWEVGRVIGGDVASACEAGAARGQMALVDHIRGRIDGLLAVAGLDPESVTCRTDVDGPRLRITLQGPIPDGLRNALAVRTLDAVHSMGRTFGQVDVTVEPLVKEAALPSQ
jgi:hypothetical protein